MRLEPQTSPTTQDMSRSSATPVPLRLIQKAKLLSLTTPGTASKFTSKRKNQRWSKQYVLTAPTGKRKKESPSAEGLSFSIQLKAAGDPNAGFTRLSLRTLRHTAINPSYNLVYFILGQERPAQGPLTRGTNGSSQRLHQVGLPGRNTRLDRP